MRHLSAMTALTIALTLGANGCVTTIREPKTRPIGKPKRVDVNEGRWMLKVADARDTSVIRQNKLWNRISGTLVEERHCLQRVIQPTEKYVQEERQAGLGYVLGTMPIT